MTGSPSLLAQPEVLGAAAGRDVDDAGAFVLADLVPLDDAVDVGRRAQLVDDRSAKAARTTGRSSKAAAVVPAHAGLRPCAPRGPERRPARPCCAATLPTQ